MANKQLATYLNNHLAASVTALELLSTLEANQDNTDLVRFAAELHAEIEAEQQELKNLMEQLQITKDAPRQAVGWITEKFTQLKLRMDDSKDGDLYILESLELLLIGIEGKRGLWSALTATTIPGLPTSNYAELVKRSEQQQQRVEPLRLAAAKAAFTS